MQCQMFIEHPGDLADHPKVLALGQGERMAALGLYAVATDWCIRFAPGSGIVPTAVTDRHDGRNRLAGALVAAELWESVGDGNAYRFVHWAEPASSNSDGRADGRNDSD